MANQTIVDDYLINLGTVTLDQAYLPIKTINQESLLNQHVIIANYPDYLPASITVYHDNVKSGFFPLLFPQSFQESLSASFIKESPVGSAYPIVAYSHTGETTIPIQFTALAEYLPGGFNTLRSYIEGLKDMVRPKYSGDIVKSPTVLVQFADVVFEGVCNSMNVAYSQVYGNKSFIKADIDCSFTVTKYKS